MSWGALPPIAMPAWPNRSRMIFSAWLKSSCFTRAKITPWIWSIPERKHVRPRAQDRDPPGSAGAFVPPAAVACAVGGADGRRDRRRNLGGDRAAAAAGTGDPAVARRRQHLREPAPLRARGRPRRDGAAALAAGRDPRARARAVLGRAGVLAGVAQPRPPRPHRRARRRPGLG